jgi:DNA replication protein DnaC
MTLDYRCKEEEHTIAGVVYTSYAYRRDLCICEARRNAERGRLDRETREGLADTARFLKHEQYMERCGLEGDLLEKTLEGMKKRADVSGLDQARTDAHIFVRDFPARKGMIISGHSHVGKTHIAAAVVKALIEKPEPVEAHFIKAVDIFPRLIQGYREGNSDPVEYYARVPFLAIDDLGLERLKEDSDWAYSQLLSIIDKREACRRWMFISTNLDKEGLLKRYKDRVTNRLFRCCVWRSIVGKAYTEVGE